MGHFHPNFTEVLAVIWSEFLHHVFLHHSFLNFFCFFFSHLTMLWLAFLHIFPLQEKSVSVCMCMCVCVFACAHAHASLFKYGVQRSTLVVFLSYYLSFVLKTDLSLSTKWARLTGQWAPELGLSVSLLLNYKYNTKIFKMWVPEILWEPFSKDLSKVFGAICIESVRQITFNWCFLDWLLSNQFQMVDIFSPNHSPQHHPQVQSLFRVGLERIWSPSPSAVIT